MARLSIALHPLLSKEIIILLNSNEIHNVVDFTSKEPGKLVKITNLKYKEILLIKKQILRKHVIISNGLENYNNLITSTAIISTGINSLDEILEGGLYTSNIYEICGLPDSGKSQICASIVTNVAYNLKQSLYYIDSKRDFSCKRIWQILREKNLTNEEATQNILKHIEVIQILDIYQLVNTLHNIKNSVSKGLKIRLIVVDSLPAIFNQIITNSNYRGLLNNLVNVMKFIATQFHVCFVLVNTITRWIANDSSDEIKTTDTVTLGKYWQHICNVRILVARNGNENEERTVTIVKSTKATENLNCKIVVNSNGIL